MTGDTNCDTVIDNRKIGMATSYPNTSTTMDVDCDIDIDIDIACRVYQGVHWARWAYKILCGAVVHWEYSKVFDTWSLRICYWRNGLFSWITYYLPPMRVFKRWFCFSAFCSRERGRHRTFQTKLQRN